MNTAAKAPAPQASPAPPAPPTGGPPTGVPPTPPARPFRSLSPSNFGLAEHRILQCIVTLPVGTPFEDCLRPDFWANVVHDKIVPFSKIEVHDAAGTFYAELLVRRVVLGRPVTGTKSGMQVAVLRHVALDAPEKDKPLPAAEYEVRWLNPADLWGVVKLATGQAVAKHFDTHEIATQHLAAMSLPSA